MNEIRFAKSAVDDLESIPRFRRGEVLDAIERQLGSEPANASRHRKELVGLVPPWNQVRPVWELRVGEFRVFYDVDLDGGVVIVQAVRRKGRKATKEVL